MKFIKKCPLFLILVSTAILFTAAAAGGRNSIYKEQELNLWKAPLLSLVFTGMNENIYPWQLASFQNTMSMAENEQAAEAEEPGLPSREEQAAEAEEPGLPSGDEQAAKAEETPLEDKQAASPEPQPDELSLQEEEKTAFGEGREEPLRESTREEYLNHISADIYGNGGILKAAEYEFSKVDEDYFNDALFIGDSRTVGLHDYTDLGEHGDFYCETSLTIYKALEENFKGKGTIQDALKNKDYKKIYLMVGINELGRGTTEDFMAKYTEVIDTLHEWEPEALIFIQGIMRVSGKKNNSDKIFNNGNINARNNAIATLADNQQVFYIDVNEVVCDEEGNLNAEYTFDQIHLLGVYNDIWKQFLLDHGVEE